MQKPPRSCSYVALLLLHLHRFKCLAALMQGSCKKDNLPSVSCCCRQKSSWSWHSKSWAGRSKSNDEGCLVHLRPIPIGYNSDRCSPQTTSAFQVRYSRSQVWFSSGCRIIRRSGWTLLLIQFFEVIASLGKLLCWPENCSLLQRSVSYSWRDE